MKPGSTEYRGTSASRLHMRPFESASCFLLSLVRPNPAIQFHTVIHFEEPLGDGHSLYSICFRPGGDQWHTAHFLNKSKLWSGVVSYTAFLSTSWNDLYLHSPRQSGKAHLPLFQFNERNICTVIFSLHLKKLGLVC